MSLTCPFIPLFFLCRFTIWSRLPFCPCSDRRKNDHIAVELLTKRFPDNIQKLLLVISTILTSIVTALVAARTGQEALTQYNNGAFSMEAGRKVLIWPSYFFLPIGFAMISVVAAWKAIAILTGKKSGLSTLSIEGSYIPKDLTK